MLTRLYLLFHLVCLHVVDVVWLVVSDDSLDIPEIMKPLCCVVTLAHCVSSVHCHNQHIHVEVGSVASVYVIT